MNANRFDNISILVVNEMSSAIYERDRPGSEIEIKSYECLKFCHETVRSYENVDRGAYEGFMETFDEAKKTWQ